jgi:PPK2 family polyphosphate:nucleotide phosphotransferase
MFEAVASPYLVSDDRRFDARQAPTAPPDGAPSEKKCKKGLDKSIDKLFDLQRVLYAHDRYSLLLVFQALDAAGKDGTIRAVLSGINPAGCQVHSFKAPSSLEIDHDFLWRSARRLPERGRIGVFNRSYYEEVLVVRVHPEILAAQKLPNTVQEGIWDERLESIRDHELHLARNGTVILKFWLNVSLEEQRRRFLARLDEPQKHWKFSKRDVEEQAFRDAYVHAYEEALRATSCSWAPWYTIPADDKPFMRHTVADIIVRTLESLPLHYPVVEAEQRRSFEKLRPLLETDTD